MDFEALRNKYRPSEIRILFIGESPPAGGTFFYAGKSNLHDATRDAFHANLPRIRSRPFLRAFADLGCYLEDLCPTPVNQWGITDPRRVKARGSGEAPLAARLVGSSPRAVVVVMKAIVPNVRRALEANRLVTAEWHALPFPGRHRSQFVAELTEVLRALDRAGHFLDVPSAAIGGCGGLSSSDGAIVDAERFRLTLTVSARAVMQSRSVGRRAPCCSCEECRAKCVMSNEMEAAPGFEPACRGQLENLADLPSGPPARLGLCIAPDSPGVQGAIGESRGPTVGSAAMAGSLHSP